MGEKLFSFETIDEIVKHSSEHGFNDVNFPFAHNVIWYNYMNSNTNTNIIIRIPVRILFCENITTE